MKKLNVIKVIAGFVMATAMFGISAFSSFAAEGKVTAETAKIRSQASTESEVVGSTVKGKTIDILEAVKDSSGTVWYKVSVAEGGYGYIRSDLVETSETIEVSSNAGSTQTTAQPAETVPTSIGEQPATIRSGNNVNIRSGASTQHKVVVSLPGGTAITLIGEANDSAGNKWYQLSCNYNGRTVEGYVRSDLISIGAAAEGGQETEAEGMEGEDPQPAEGESPGEQEGAPEEGSAEPVQTDEYNEYEVVYTANKAGEYDYYLFMNADGTMVKVSELLNATATAKESIQKMQSQIDNEKIIIIILAVVIVLLFIVITVLLIKIRALYYEDYEEEEEEEEEPAPVRKRVKKQVAEEQDEPAPQRKKRPAAQDTSERPVKAQDRSKELHAAEKKEPVKKPASRKPQNFLIDDDEFEFEFLNMDDKDL